MVGGGGAALVARSRHGMTRRHCRTALRVSLWILTASLVAPPLRAQRTADTTTAAITADSMVPYRPVSIREYIGQVAGPRTLGRVVLLSSFDQATGRPRERDRTWRGFEDRLATRAAQQAIAGTITLGIAAAFDERPTHFILCTCATRGDRLRHAASTPWRVDTPTGPRWSALNPISQLASALLVTTVNPRGFSVGEGLRSGGTGVLGASLFAVAREFWPWRRRPPGV
jgi:hypothetical protein